MGSSHLKRIDRMYVQLKHSIREYYKTHYCKARDVYHCALRWPSQSSGLNWLHILTCSIMFIFFTKMNSAALNIFRQWTKQVKCTYLLLIRDIVFSELISVAFQHFETCDPFINFIWDLIADNYFLLLQFSIFRFLLFKLPFLVLWMTYFYLL